MTPEKRKGTRAPIEIRVEYRTVGSFLSDWVVNISRGGMFIHTKNPLKIGAKVRLVFSLPGMPFLFDVNAEVKWSQTGPTDRQALPGMGVEFVQVDERVQKRIEAYVKQHEAQMPKSIRQDHAEPPRIEMGDVPDNEVTQPRVRRSDIKPPPLPRRKKTK
jgi:type IV pilus assembly protein PilZ